MATTRPPSFRPALPLAIPVLLCFFVSHARSELLRITFCPPITTIPFADNNIAAKNASQDLRSNMVNNISDDGFLYTSNSLGGSETKVYGLALCRPDVPVDRDCRSCLQDAADRLYDCDKGLVWSDDCYMRSDSYDFYGGAGNNNFAGRSSEDSASSTVDPTPLFERVIEKAQRRRILYGVENMTVLNGTESGYAMAQCTRDINSAKCGQCLNDLLLLYKQSCTGVRTCRLAHYNCNLAYDSSPSSFLDVDDPKPISEAPKASTNPKQGSESPIASPDVVHQKTSRRVNTRTSYTAAVLGGSAAALCFLVLCIICLCRKCKGGQKTRFQKMANQLDYEQNKSEDQLSAAMNNKEDSGMKSWPVQTEAGLRLYRHEEIKKATENFDLAKVLGRGGYGTVYEGDLDGEKIAVKVLSETSSQGAEEFKREVETIGERIRHRNFVPLKGYCTEKKYIVYEYMPNGSVKDLIAGDRKLLDLDWNRRKNIIFGIAKGVLHLHHDAPVKCVHRDLKLANVLLDQDYSPKISDFGMAMSTNEDRERFQKMDVFKFGVMLVEIVSGQITNSCVPLLLDSAYRNFRCGKLHELVDPDIDKINCGEAVRFIQIGLLCVQKDARPDITDVENWLRNDSLKLDDPTEPGNCAADGITTTGPIGTGS